MEFVQNGKDRAEEAPFLMPKQPDVKMIPVWQEEVDTFERKTLEGINEDDLQSSISSVTTNYLKI